MDDEVRKAADRRGEVGVAGEGEAEMAEIVGAVDGLALAAQDGLVDQRRFIGLSATCVQHAVEIARAHPRAGRAP